MKSECDPENMVAVYTGNALRNFYEKQAMQEQEKGVPEGLEMICQLINPCPKSLFGYECDYLKRSNGSYYCINSSVIKIARELQNQKGVKR